MKEFNKWRPKYQNEESYDMKERLQIDEDEFNARKKLYPKESDIEEVDIQPSSPKVELSPIQKKILEERQRVSSSNLDSNSEKYLNTFSPEEAMKNNPRLQDEDGNILEGEALRQYWLDQQDEQRRAIESGELKPEEVKKFLLVRNMLNERKSGK